MSRTRVFSCGVALVAGLITLGLGAQTTPVTGQGPLGLRPNVGLPAIDGGALADYTHTPATFEARRRAAIRSALRSDGVSSSGASYARGKVIVKFRDDASPTARMNAVSSATRTGAVATRPSYSNFDIITIDAHEDAEAVARLLGTRAEVAYAQPAYRVHTMFVPNDPYYKSSQMFTPGQWNLPLIGLEQAWDIQPQAGSNITVAVLDTGIAYMNAALTPTIREFVNDRGEQMPALGQVPVPYSAATQLVRPERIVAPHDFIWDTDTPLDFDGHGTHVAGTIGQLTNDALFTAGVAFNVKLMPVKVIAGMWDDLFGAPNLGTDATVAQGIRYAVANGAKVINMSLGRTGPPAPVVEEAVTYAVGKGVFIAIAAGNGYEEGNEKEVIADIASRVQGAVAVASVDRNALAGDGKCTGTATSPSCHAYYSSSGSWVELAAPGGSERGFGADGYVWQQTFDYRFTDTFLSPPAEYGPPRFDKFNIVGYIGTSQATPHVTGVAAMMMQQGITDPAAIEAALERFATDLGPPGRDDLYGYGLVNARNSLRGLGIAR